MVGLVRTGEAGLPGGGGFQSLLQPLHLRGVELGGSLEVAAAAQQCVGGVERLDVEVSHEDGGRVFGEGLQLRQEQVNVDVHHPNFFGGSEEAGHVVGRYTEAGKVSSTGFQTNHDGLVHPAFGGFPLEVDDVLGRVRGWAAQDVLETPPGQPAEGCEAHGPGLLGLRPSLCRGGVRNPRDVDVQGLIDIPRPSEHDTHVVVELLPVLSKDCDVATLCKISVQLPSPKQVNLLETDDFLALRPLIQACYNLRKSVFLLGAAGWALREVGGIAQLWCKQIVGGDLNMSLLRRSAFASQSR
mmetsp:Transcript_70642/g.147991  ORF Transcript_70642/g.147991 Transcript_70642/m.147991 type:complete len:299 (-) Transcript_70642:297-1193(-)